MSISMERFGLQERTDESAGLPKPLFPYRVECRACGFEPRIEGIGEPVTPMICPKCAARAWERYTIPGSLLIDADHRAGRASEFPHRAAALRTARFEETEVTWWCGPD